MEKDQHHFMGMDYRSGSNLVILRLLSINNGPYTVEVENNQRAITPNDGLELMEVTGSS